MFLPGTTNLLVFGNGKWRGRHCREEDDRAADNFIISAMPRAVNAEMNRRRPKVARVSGRQSRASSACGAAGS
jgi:hypothetical protein